MAFNPEFSLYKNIQMALWMVNKSIDTMAQELSTTPNSIKTIIAREFKRGNKTAPLDKRVYEYLELNAKGFKEYCRAHNITLAS